MSFKSTINISQHKFINLYNRFKVCYHKDMAIDSNKNKRFFVTISKKDYERLEKQAKNDLRSVSKQSLLYILEGLKRDEKAE